MKRLVYLVGTAVALAVALYIVGALQRDPATRRAASGLAVVGRPLARGLHTVVDPAVTATSGNAGAALIAGLAVFAVGVALFARLRSSTPAVLAWAAVAAVVGVLMYLPATAAAVKRTWATPVAVVTVVVR